LSCLTFFQYIIDYIFPPSAEELKIRSIDGDWLIKNAPRAGNTEFPFIKALFSYQNPLIKELIWQIKYKKNMHAVKCAGYALYSELDGLEDAVLIPIPISKKRRRERGYNQCELLLNEIIKLDSEKRFSSDYDLLIREKDIEKQTHKNRNERISNTKHIF
jgi:predicted amidophosphoribosyltransferase